MRILDVVNEMLGSMGETALNSLTQSHTFLAPAKKVFEDQDRDIQARGWWCNTEDLTGSPSPTDGMIYLPNDILDIRCPRKHRRVVQRGNRLYDMVAGDYVFTEDIPLVIVRHVPFEQLPEALAQYIAAAAVERFQSSYDGDSTKTRALMQATADARAQANTVHTRNAKINFMDYSAALWRLRRVTDRNRF